MAVMIPEQNDAPDDEAAPDLVVEVDPSDADGLEHGDAVELVRSGMVRIRIGAHTWRLRRPFFGELKSLRIAWQEIVDELGDEAIRAQAIAQQAKADYSEITKDGTDLSFEQQADAMLELRRQDRDVGRRLSDKGDELRLSWWAQVFDTLSVEHPEKAPPDLPAWMASGVMPSRVLQHWRSVPLARG